MKAFRLGIGGAISNAGTTTAIAYPYFVLSSYLHITPTHVLSRNQGLAWTKMVASVGPSLGVTPPTRWKHHTFHRNLHPFTSDKCIGGCALAQDSSSGFHLHLTYFSLPPYLAAAGILLYSLRSLGARSKESETPRSTPNALSPPASPMHVLSVSYYWWTTRHLLCHNGR